MNCPQSQQHLDAYLDGELAEEIRQQVDRHLHDCHDCRREYEELRTLVRQAGELDSELSPTRNLWPGIDARIRSDRGRETPWWLQLAAAGIALAILSVPLSVWWSGNRAGEAPSPMAVEIDKDSVTLQAQRARSEDGVLLARTDLVTAIERHRDVIEDDTLRIFEQNVVLLDQAIGELRTALEEDPQSLRLHMLLASRYQQERKLLQKISRV